MNPLDLQLLPRVQFSHLTALPAQQGIYFALDSRGHVLYLGRSTNIYARWRGYHHQKTRLKQLDCSEIAWLEVHDADALAPLEQELISTYSPPLNGGKGHAPGVNTSPDVCVPSVQAERSVHLSEFRGQVREIVEEASSGKRIIVKRYNGPAAALVPLEDYLALGRLDAHAYHPTPPEGHMHRLVITNISGGEGKSTLARETAYELHARGYRVALIDTDPQASLTKSLGLHDDPASAAYDPHATILSAFEVDTNPRLGTPQDVHGVDVWPSNDSLYRADSIIAADLSKQGNLREAVDQLQGQYDFLIIDTKPGITPLLNAAVAAADQILVPVSGDKGMENLDKLSRLTRAARGFSPDIRVALFIPNRHRAQTVLSRAVLEDLSEYQEIAPIARPIRDSVVVGEAARLRQPLVTYNPRADVTQDLRHVVDDLLLVLGLTHLAPAGETA